MAAVASLFLVPLCLWLLKHSSLVRKNYRGAQVPCPGGIVFPLSITLALVFGKVTGIYSRSDFVSLIALTWGFGVLGFVDDIAGSNKYKGFRGHIKAFFQGTITTGALKAVFGGVLALFVGIYSTGAFLRGVVAGITIALSANITNLLDLAPGRALKGFFLGLLLVVPLLSSDSFALVLPVLVTAIVYFPADIREEVMMGDTGSNLLGGIWGFWIATRLSFVPLMVLAGFLLVMNALGERISFSKLIQKNRVLMLLDGLGRRSPDRV